MLGIVQPFMFLPRVMALDRALRSFERIAFARFTVVSAFILSPQYSWACYDWPGQVATRAGCQTETPRGTNLLLQKMGFEYDKFKVQVKLAISRIISLQQRHQNSLCGRRKEIADLLKAGQEERARLLVPTYIVW